ncbi:hypothetical protein Tsubulata_026674 [Turnera subulata]|uniref:NAD(P)H-quinone oxidoreductase subunit L, chloroplastic n=1 Tax=Turnera subulata TaxID=218843 RepID=A0A9Q0JAD9_9ROSI|nr:hypothetical protein Tsubulata_026674 [Turnera subulata]
MSCSFTCQIPKALPSLSPCKRTPLPISCELKLSKNKLAKKVASISTKPEDSNHVNKFSMAIQLGALLASVEQPAFALTGVNNPEDLSSVLIQSAIIAFWYFILMPPIIMNWVRIRLYKRKLLEMYTQFMFVFLFFPGILLWAPFLNFRKFPRDPTMKYPWSKPDLSKVKNGYLKYPWATPEDYDNV